MYLYAFSLANPPKLFSCSLNVWDHNGHVPVVVTSIIVVVYMSGVVMIGVLVAMVASFKLLLELV